MATITYARVVSGAVAEVLPALDASLDPAEVFHADVAEQLVAIPAGLVGQVAQGWTWSAGAFAAPAEPTGAELAALKDGLKSLVDGEAERLRLTYVTPGAGQAVEYQETQAQAFAALANPSGATAALYPMLAATIGIDKDPQTGQPATDVLGVARSIQAAYDAWLAVGAAIRGARLRGKAAIEAAPTYAAALAAFSAIAWPPAG